MTANPFAALLDGVPRYGVNVVSAKMERHPYGVYVELDLVLAALAAAVPDDLAGAGKVLEGVKVAEAICRSEDCFQQAAQFKAAADLITALLARIAAQEVQIKGLQRTYDDLYSDALADAKSDAQEFDSDLWKMVRAYLDDLHFDWRDFMEDGVTADEAMTHIRECMNEETRRAEAAETALAAERAKMAKLLETLTLIESMTVHRCDVIGPFKIEMSDRQMVVDTWNRRVAPPLRITGPNSDGEYWLHIKAGGRSGGVNLGGEHGPICKRLLDAASETGAKE